MINVIFKKDDAIIELSVKGHADYAINEDLDLVCACVSSIVIGGLNAIQDELNYKMKVESGDVEVKVFNSNKHDDAVLDTIIIQLRTLETKFSNYINIKSN